MWKGKQKRIRSRVLLCTSTLESWTEVLTASTWGQRTHIIYLFVYYYYSFFHFSSCCIYYFYTCVCVCIIWIAAKESVIVSCYAMTIKILLLLFYLLMNMDAEDSTTCSTNTIFLMLRYGIWVGQHLLYWCSLNSHYLAFIVMILIYQYY